MSAFLEETVLSVHHWTDRLFSFRTTRSPSFRYENGQFTMIGLAVEGKPLLRAYSLVSPNYADELEFLSIKVPDGPLTSKLQHIQVGDKVLVGRKPTGTLLIDYLLPGRPQDLWADCQIGRIGSRVAQASVRCWQASAERPIAIARLHLLLAAAGD